MIARMLSLFAGLAACALLAAAPASAQGKILIRFSTAAPPVDFLSKSLERFKEELEKAAPDQFDIKLHRGLEPVSPGHRGAGDPARQSRDEHHDDLRGRPADSRVGLPQSRLPVPRLGSRHQGAARPRRRALRQGHCRQDGDRDPGADLSRHAPGQPARHARREEPGRSRRREAAHAGRARNGCCWASRSA